MNKFFGIISLVLIWVGGYFFGISENYDTLESHRQLIDACEKDLSRTETCVLVAQPKKGGL